MTYKEALHACRVLSRWEALAYEREGADRVLRKVCVMRRAEPEAYIELIDLVCGAAARRETSQQTRTDLRKYLEGLESWITVRALAAHLQVSQVAVESALYVVRRTHTLHTRKVPRVGARPGRMELEYRVAQREIAA